MNRRQGGFAMILVIWALILLTSIAASFTHAVRVETATGTFLVDQVRAEAIANAGLHRAILGASIPDREVRWKPDGRRYEIPWPDAKLELRLRSEAGKVDINFAPKAILVGILQSVIDSGDAVAQADAILDWRDRDNDASPLGAEAAAYLNAGRSYVPPNGPFSSLSELAQVMGFNGETVERLRPHMTIYSRRAKIDALNASALVLAAVPGINRELAEAFVSERERLADTGKTVDMTLLQPGLRYLETRGGGGLVSAEITVQLDNGYRYAENAVFAVSRSTRGYEILARAPLPANAGDGR